MGGFDLYGRYYSSSRDALAAESAQCAEITANAALAQTSDQQLYLAQILDHVQKLELRVEALEKLQEERSGR